MFTYLKKEKVMTIAFVLAIVSALLVHPDKNYVEYVDFRVLALLFGLMLLVKGFQEIGLFDLLIQKVFEQVKDSRTLCQLLVLLCFFLSMLITNDVALITFVPFAIAALRMCHQEKYMIQVVVLQTLAANLGSMLTPIGNPQNLYLFTASGMAMGTFLKTMLPTAILSLALLMAASILIKKEEIHLQVEETETNIQQKPMVVYAILFVVNLLVVFRILTWIPALLLTIAGVILIKKGSLLRQVDYALLLTFIGFFVFVGNMGRIPAVSTLVAQLLKGREILVSALFSQVLSNVPAAILLSGFTENFQELLVGVNVGGLGTLIASMASLISYKLYAEEADADKGKYLLTFTLWNVVGLVVLLLFCAIWY